MDSKESEEIVGQVLAELKRAEDKFPPFNSAHEGWGVLYEEVDELWDAVRMQDGKERDKQMYAEAIQVAAMALRFMLYVRLKERQEKERAEKLVELKATLSDVVSNTDEESLKKLWATKVCEICKIDVRPNHKHCPKCGSAPAEHELRNYSMMWHDGDVHCLRCGEYVRGWDAG